MTCVEVVTIAVFVAAVALGYGLDATWGRSDHASLFEQLLGYAVIVVALVCGLQGVLLP